MPSMHIAIESSARQASVALFLGDVAIAQATLAADQPTARTLFDALEHLMAEVREREEALSFVGIGVGPGSFTGLRIGVTAAKTLAYAMGCPVVPVDSLAAIVLRMRRHVPNAALWDVAVDAYRGQVFWRREEPSDPFGASEPSVSTRIVNRSEWIESLRQVVEHLGDSRDEGDGGVACLAGDAWGRNVVDEIKGECLSCEFWVPNAESVGVLAWQSWNSGTAMDPMHLVPNYLRESAAEENLKRKVFG